MAHFDTFSRDIFQWGASQIDVSSQENTIVITLSLVSWKSWLTSMVLRFTRLEAKFSPEPSQRTSVRNHYITAAPPKRLHKVRELLTFVVNPSIRAFSSGSFICATTLHMSHKVVVFWLLNVTGLCQFLCQLTPWSPPLEYLPKHTGQLRRKQRLFNG